MTSASWQANSAFMPSFPLSELPYCTSWVHQNDEEVDTQVKMLPWGLRIEQINTIFTCRNSVAPVLVESSWNVMAHDDAGEGKWRVKLANRVGSQYSSHYIETWCIQHYYRWCAHLGCQQSTELTPQPIKMDSSVSPKDEMWFYSKFPLG